MRTTLIPSSRIWARSRRACSSGAEIIARRVRLERPVSDALDEKLPVALEEELGERTDADRRSLAHEELFLVQGEEDAKF